MFERQTSSVSARQCKGPTRAKEVFVSKQRKTKFWGGGPEGAAVEGTRQPGRLRFVGAPALAVVTLLAAGWSRRARRRQPRPGPRSAVASCRSPTYLRGGR